MKNQNKMESQNSNAQELNPENLEKISGGYIHYNSDNATHKWEVIKESNGEILGSYQTKQEAKSKAPQFKQSSDVIGNKKLEEIRSSKYRTSLDL